MKYATDRQKIDESMYAYFTFCFSLILNFGHLYIRRFDAADKGEDFDKAVKDIKKDAEN